VAWTGQCRLAFKHTADTLLWKQGDKKNVSEILKRLSEESGIPFKTLERWWYQEESLKNEEGQQSTDNTSLPSSSPQNNGTHTNIPICKECGKNPVHLDCRTGRPYGQKSKYYGLCSTCRTGKQKMVARHKANGGAFITTVCPKCGYTFNINPERITVRRPNDDSKKE
jgi:DNA-directed RNA polymerase subunit M/transcription elongation factor TFIIS